MDWEHLARAVAPTVATGLAGPLGGVVTSIVAGFLFPTTEKAKLTPLDVAKRIATLTDPADIAKLREAEQAVRKFEADNDFRFAQVEAESQQDAREMRTTALASGNKTADRLAWLTLISFLVVAGLVLLVVGLLLSNAITFTNRPEAWAAISGLIGSVLGYFSANANQVIGFYFGSSAGSAAKTDQLSQNASDAISALGRVAPRPQPPQVGSAVVQVEASPSKTTATVTAGKPEAGRLAQEDAPTAPAPDSEALAQRWQSCVGFVLAREGGFVNDPTDHGGPTNLGITQSTLGHFRKANATAEDVQRLSRDEAEEIYRQGYWDLTRCDDLPSGVDLCVFDTAVLCGPGRAGRFLQTAVGLQGADIDGRIGKQTLGATRAQAARDVIEAMAGLREQHHRSVVEHDPTQERFLSGWLSRVRALRTRALEMATSAGTPGV